MPAQLLRRMLLSACLAATFAATAAFAKTPDDFVGTWTLAASKLGAKCRLMLGAEKSDKGDFFLGMPAACRHAMPETAAIGRWSAPDDSHITLDDPAGAPVLTFSGAKGTFTATNADQTYALTKMAATGRSAAGFEVVEPKPTDEFAPIQPVASKRTKTAIVETETVADLAGRYAVLREKRDTGCMLTLDSTHARGPDRAQLAPGCRDQGIVIFDPAGWQILKGALVLTARAGHKTHLLKQADGTWLKDPKDGGKPLGLKKL